MWGIGPHDSGYSLGGQAYWAAGLHLYHPLPFLQGPINEFLKTHLFLTTGNLFCYGNVQEIVCCALSLLYCIQVD